MSTSPTSGTGSTSSSNPYAFLNGSSATTVSAAKQQSDRFLKLLTTQLQNQDPLNPMDNAQMTSQMAQISTVSGIETLNASIQAMSTQFVQMQALQGASLVGHDVMLEGNQLDIDAATAKGSGSFELASHAASVLVDIVNGAGKTVDTVDLGAVSAGRRSFDWDAGKVTNADSYTFKVRASSSGTAIPVTALMRDRVEAVNTNGSQLTLELQRNGAVPYEAVKAVN